jgi:hypothetical protein
MSNSVGLNKYYTYQLIDSITHIPFYVGKGCGNRMYKHEKDVKLGKIPNKTNYDLFYKIKYLIDNQMEVEYEKLKENVDEMEALALEAAFIDFYGIENLCNYCKSWSGIMYRSEKTRKRQSDAHKGIRSYMYGKPKTTEQKLKNSLAHTGEKNSRYDNNIYTFFNEKLNITEKCTQYQLRMKYNLDSSGLFYLINGKRFSIKGWTLGITYDEIEKRRRERISKNNKGKPKSESHRKNLWKNRKHIKV